MALLMVGAVKKKPPEQAPEGYFDRPIRQMPEEPPIQVSPLNREIGLREVERFRRERK